MARTFNPILDDLPASFVVGEREYPIDTDFRVVLAWLRVAERTDLEEAEKMLLGIRLFIADGWATEDILGLHDQIGKYIVRGQEPDAKRSGAEVFNLSVDAGRIFAAFMQVYRINLRTAKMHWWTFCDLLEGLPHGTHLAEVIEIRRRPFEKGMTAGQKNELQRAKDRYRIGEKVDPMKAIETAMMAMFGGKR